MLNWKRKIDVLQLRHSWTLPTEPDKMALYIQNFLSNNWSLLLQSTFWNKGYMNDAYYIIRQNPQNHCCGSGSYQRYGSFYHPAKKIRKTLIPTVFWLLYAFLSLKIMEIYLKKVISKFLGKKIIFYWPWNHWHKEQDLDPDPLVRGTDPHQNDTDPQHCSKP